MQYCDRADKTVAEYEAQFSKLSKYASEMVASDHRRKMLFIQGLHVELQESLATATLPTYGDAVETALKVEDTKMMVKSFQSRKRNLNMANRALPEQNSSSMIGRGVGGGKVQRGAFGRARGTIMGRGISLQVIG